jgi:hypothetical protein
VQLPPQIGPDEAATTKGERSWLRRGGAGSAAQSERVFFFFFFCESGWEPNRPSQIKAQHPIVQPSPAQPNVTRPPTNQVTPWASYRYDYEKSTARKKKRGKVDLDSVLLPSVCVSTPTKSGTRRGGPCCSPILIDSFFCCEVRCVSAVFRCRLVGWFAVGFVVSQSL